jgi:hypothetical protein
MTPFRQIYEDLPATIEVPAGLRHRRVEVILLPLDEAVKQNGEQAVDANGWPIGFLEETFGSVPDIVERPSQGNFEDRESLE